MRSAAFALAALPLLGCNDTGVQALNFGRTAIVTGDFDTVEQLIEEVSLETTVQAEIVLVDGYIDGPRFESEAPGDGRPLELTVEDLLRTDSTGGLQLYKTVFFSDGMRGCNEFVYNGVSEDDHLVQDDTVAENIERSVRNGLRLYFSDWTYDLMEATWPDLIDWLGPDAELDAAQRGIQQTVNARIVDEGLAEHMGVPVGSQLDLVFNFGSWAVIDAVDEAAVDVLVAGDITYDDPATGELRVKEDAPLLVAARIGSGVVLFTTFHNEAQISDETRAVLAYGLGQLSR